MEYRAIRYRMFAAVVLLLCAGFWAAPAARGEKPSYSFAQDYPVGEARSLALDFGVGELRVEASGGDQVRVELRIECGKPAEECGDLADKVRVVSRSNGRELAIDIKGPRGGSARDLKVAGRVLAPKSLALEVDMGVGDLAITGFERDLAVDLGVGDIDVRLPESAVRSVLLDAGVGKATLHLKNGRIEGTGFVSQGLKWANGAGAAAVGVDCGVGDVDVTLY